MTLTREDYAKSQKKRQEQRQNDRIPALELLSQAQVSAEHLIGDHQWDTYLSYIQGAVEVAVRHLDALDAMLVNPAIVSYEKIMEIKSERNIVASRIEAWQAALALPKQIIEQGEKAREALIKLAGSDEDERAA